jgi:hypothetical protein
VSRRKGIFYIEYKKGKIGHFLHRNCIIVTEGKIGGYK